MNLRPVWSTLRQTFSAWSGHEAPRLGAALAFYTILSLAPLMILIIAVVALVFGHSAAQDQIVSQVQGMMGPDGAKAIRGMIEHAQKPASGIFASIVGLITLLFGASGVFGELRSALNKIWEVKPETSSGILAMIRERFFSFGMVLAVGFLLLVSLIISAALAAIGKFFGGLLPMPEFVLSGINFVVSLLAIAVLFALIFKYVPETKIAWKDVWVGALATALLFTIGKFLIGFYLGKAGVGSAYGAAGSLIVVIIWVYYSSLIFFFGAEFTRALQPPQTSSEKKAIAKLA
jgi:membrane protein